MVMYSLCAVGAACNAIGGSGGPLAVFFVAVITCEIGKLVSKETKIDIIVTPAVTVIVGVVLAMLLAPVCKNICDALGAFIGWATDLRPFWMGMIISVVVGIVLTLPISSAAICAAVGISGGAVLAGLADGSVTVESLEWSCAGRWSGNRRMLCTYAWFCNLELSRIMESADLWHRDLELPCFRFRTL